MEDICNYDEKSAAIVEGCFLVPNLHLRNFKKSFGTTTNSQNICLQLIQPKINGNITNTFISCIYICDVDKMFLNVNRLKF